MTTAVQSAILLLPKFPLGQLVITPGASNALDGDHISARSFLQRHSACDWGDVCEEDKEANDSALQNNTRLLSVYHKKDIKFYVITEHDRSMTTILLPEEY
ncbi:hypothetical protein KXJ72_17465 (plasmid) [Comamonas aquatica]|nr:hypothetical protein KXJ72_17465 [Comamonas aquatica]